MRINHNIPALMANHQLQINNSGLDKSLEKLSSGYRINRAADDAAGMAISQKMKTQIRGLEQGSRNASDGISVIQTAEGALSEVEAMLQRMRELSVQSANGTNTSEDRLAIQNEINQLSSEVERISKNTEFNTKTLLDGNIDRKSYSNNTKVKLISLSDTVDTKKYQVTVVDEAKKGAATGGTNKVFSGAGGTVGVGEGGIININGEDVVVLEGESRDAVIEKIRNACSLVDVKMSASENGAAADITKPGVAFTFTTAGYGSDQTIDIYTDNDVLSDILGLTGLQGNTYKGTDAKVTLESGFSTTTTVTSKGNVVTISDDDGFQMKLEVQDGAKAAGAAGEKGKATITVLDAGPMSLQIGANEGQLMEVRIPEVSPATLGISALNVSTANGAQNSITALDKAVAEVSSHRAKLGAYQNRLEHAIANLDVSAQNLTEALSRIEDVDMAEEMANYTQLNVLTQAGNSMLAQANQRPQEVLTLLQG